MLKVRVRINDIMQDELLEISDNVVAGLNSDNQDERDFAFSSTRKKACTKYGIVPETIFITYFIGRDENMVYVVGWR